MNMNHGSSYEDRMEVLYGEGWYVEGDKKISGKIILGENKLYLKSPSGDLPQTYILIEKIVFIEKQKGGIRLGVRLSQTNTYQAFLKGNSVDLRELIEELVKRAGLKKRFLRAQWMK